MTTDDQWILPDINQKLDENQQLLLNLALGDQKCNNSTVDKSINYVLLAIVAAIIFLILNLPVVDQQLAILIPNSGARLLFKTLFFFLIIYLLDRGLYRWREDQVFCL